MITDELLIANATGKSPDVAIPQFFMKDVKNNFKSTQEGRPVYDSKEYVRIIIPGDRNCIPERPVKDEDKGRWPKAYTAFKQGIELVPEGMPLSQWPQVDKSQVEYLAQWNIRTVEQLATINDLNVQRMGMGMSNLRNNAALWLEQARSGAGMSRVTQERDQLKQQVAVLTDQLNDLSARMTAMAAAQADGGTMPAAPTPQPTNDVLVALMEKMAALEARITAPSPNVIGEAEAAIELAKRGRRIAELEAGQAPKRTRRTKAEMDAARAAEAQ